MISILFGKIKNSALLILGVLATALGIALKWSLSSRRRLKTERDQATAQARKRQEIMHADNEIEEQTRSHRVDLLKELDDTGDSSVFSDPNSLRKRPRD
jgi:hypothetical protein